MSLLLICDAPGCQKQIPAEVQLGRPSPPGKWMMQASVRAKDDPAILVVGCCWEHFIEATKVKA